MLMICYKEGPGQSEFLNHGTYVLRFGLIQSRTKN
jgi:hypothetical protein